MKRHFLAGQFGLNDNPRAVAGKDEKVTKFNLIGGERSLAYGIQYALDDLRRLKVFPTEVGADLLILAMHVHAADTRISRSSESQDGWTREIRCLVPVSDPVLWARTSGLLSRILNFLTGDKWTISFRPRPRKFSNIIAAKPNDLIGSPFDKVSLFSGGMDSLIGAIDELEAGSVPLLVSHAGEGAVSASQDRCFSELKHHYRRSSFERLRVWLNFPKSFVKGVASEDSTRGRSFLFFAIGVLVGTGLQQPFTLKVPENGLIALNVPLDVVRLGALSTRTTHPFYMARWNELISLLGLQGKIENPYWNKTKGEMVENCANLALFQQILPESLSCASPTKGRWQGRSAGHCGYCLPCIIRRAATETGLGTGNDPTSYAIQDLSAQPLNTNKADGRQIRSFQLAIKRLQENPGIERVLIHKLGPLTDEAKNLAALAGVYRRGMAEVSSLLSDVETRPL